jgi:glutathione S-transferase
LRWLLFDNHKFTSYFGTYRFMKSFAPTPPDQAVMAFLKGRIDGAYAIVDKHLRAHEYLVGSVPTIADFSLSGYLFYPDEESGLDWPARFPSMAAWVARLKRVPGWGNPYDVLPGERLKPRW